MKKPYFYFIAGVATILLPVGVFILFIWVLGSAVEKTFSNNDRKDNIYNLSTSNSPNQNFISTTFSNSGGGAAGWCGQKVNIRKRDEVFDSGEYVFSTNCGTKILTNWEDNNTIRISFSPNDKYLSLYQKGWNKDKTVKILYVKN